MLSSFQGGTNGVCRINTDTKETDSLPDIHGEIYTLEAFPVYANKISSHMPYATIVYV